MPPADSIPFDSIPTLAALRREERDALAPLCRLTTYDQGQTIFEEGGRTDRILFLVRGRVKVVKPAAGREVVLEILGPGEPIGAVATAVALEPSSVLSIPERELFALLERRPEMMSRLVAGMTNRLVTVNQRLADMTGSSAETRAARLFLMLAERSGGKAAGGGIEIALSLSRQEIADLIGTTPAGAARIMRRWQEEGIVLAGENGFTIRDLGKLRELAS